MNPRIPTEPDPQSPRIPKFSTRVNDFLQWLRTKNLSPRYTKDITNYLRKYLNNDIMYIGELAGLLAKIRTKNLSVAIRVYLNFLIEYNIVKDEDMVYFRKILKSQKSNPDNFVPTDEQVRDAYSKTRNGRHKTIFLLLAYSGIRITEAVKMLSEFERDRLIINGDIARYPLSYNRGQKRVSYVYMPREFALTLHKMHSTQKVALAIKYQSDLSPKYLRKWLYNFLILNNVPESVADFIEGRVPESVGSMHYLSKVKQADYWYILILKSLGAVLIDYDYPL